VIVDSTEPFGPARELFGAGFYKDVKRILTADGVVVSQAGSPFYELKTIGNLARILKPVFPVTDAYLFTNLIYPGGLWAFSFASKGLRPVKDFQPARVKAARLPLCWYNADVHAGAFALPNFVRRALGR
jgi:spermidine synthase